MNAHFAKIPGDTLPPFPDGWYFLELSTQLKKGDLKSHRFCGRDIILYRDAENVAHVLDAYCSHLGANLGKGGKIIDGNVQCPFHGFQFNGSGHCVKTGYGSQPPKNSSIRSFPVNEVNGLILAYYSQAVRSPLWEVPPVECTGFCAQQIKSYEISAHVQELQENGVDTGHFPYVHNYSGVEFLEAAQFDGPLLRTKIRSQRKDPSPFADDLVSFEFQLAFYGMGYSYVDVFCKAWGLVVHQWVLYTPIDENKTRISVVSTIHENTDSLRKQFFLHWMPRKLFNAFFAKLYHVFYSSEIKDDFKIWQHKVHLASPAVVKGDGPINLYRKFSRQFYPEYPSEQHERLYRDTKDCALNSKISVRTVHEYDEQVI